MLRKDIRSQKKQIIAANVHLTDAEAQKFWPVYDQYTAALVQVNNDKYALIKEYANSYGTMTDAQADDWAKRMLQLDVNVAALRLKFLPAFQGPLSQEDSPLRTGRAQNPNADRRPTFSADSARRAIAASKFPPIMAGGLT